MTEPKAEDRGAREPIGEEYLRKVGRWNERRVEYVHMFIKDHNLEYLLLASVPHLLGEVRRLREELEERDALIYRYENGLDEED